MKMLRPYIFVALAFNFICAGLLFLFVKNPKPYVLGLCFGGSINILLFIANYLNINRLLDQSPEKGKTRAFTGYVVRYLIYGMTLTVAALADYLSFATTALALLSIKLAIYFIHLWPKRQKGGQEWSKNEDSSSI